MGFFYWLGVSPKNWPKFKKGGMKVKKWHWNWNNASFNRATTKIFSSTVSPELGAPENVVLTWLLNSWSLFTGLFFTLKNPFLAPHPLHFFFYFTRILWFIGDLGLGLIDSHKDAVPWKILVFGNILGFPGVNWAQKWTETVTFEYVLFPLKHLILKDCSETVFVLWKTTSGQKFRGEREQKNPK